MLQQTYLKVCVCVRYTFKCLCVCWCLSVSIWVCGKYLNNFIITLIYVFQPLYRNSQVVKCFHGFFVVFINIYVGMWTHEKILWNIWTKNRNKYSIPAELRFRTWYPMMCFLSFLFKFCLIFSLHFFLCICTSLLTTLTSRLTVSICPWVKVKMEVVQGILSFFMVPSREELTLFYK